MGSTLTLDWTAVAALTALAIAITDILRRWADRRAEGRLLAQILLTEVNHLEARLSGMRADLDIAGETRTTETMEQALMERPALRAQLEAYVKPLEMPLLEQSIDRLKVLPAIASGDLAYMRYALRDLTVISVLIARHRSGDSQEFLSDAIPSLRAALEEALGATTAAQRELLRAARATRMQRWIRRRRKRRQPAA